MPNLNTARFTGEEDLPNLEQHNNHMAHVLTLDLYKNLRQKQTPSGFTIDNVIQERINNYVFYSTKNYKNFFYFFVYGIGLSLLILFNRFISSQNIFFLK